MSIVPHSADGTLPPDSIFHKWQQFWDECSRVTGKSWLICDTMKQSIIDAGFVDVREERFKWPIGTWGSDERSQDIGRWNREFWRSGTEGWVMALSTRHLGVSLFASLEGFTAVCYGMAPPRRRRRKNISLTPFSVDSRAGARIRQRDRESSQRYKAACILRGVGYPVFYISYRLLPILLISHLV